MINPVILLAGTAFLAATTAQAAVVTLDFEGVGDQDRVGGFYDGEDGPDYGAKFSGNARALVDRDAGGNGNFANEPTPDTILFFLSGRAATLNHAGGFRDGFSFYYTSTNFAGAIDVYEGFDATGSLLARLALPMTGEGVGDPDGGTGDARGSFGVFDAIGAEFEGTARSVDFGGTVNQIGFDNITFGSDLPGLVGGVEPAIEEPVVEEPDGEMADGADGMDGSGDAPAPVPLPAGLPLLLGALGVTAAIRRRG